jgi:hypothetical protein
VEMDYEFGGNDADDENLETYYNNFDNLIEN